MSRKVNALTLCLSTDGFTDAAVVAGAKTFLDGTNSTSAATYYSVPIFVEPFDYFRLHFSCPSTGSPSGTMKLQASVDKGRNNPESPSANDLLTWVDIPFVVNGVVTTTQTVSNATTVALDENRCNYRWLRMVGTLASGTVTPTVKIQLKGDGGS